MLSNWATCSNAQWQSSCMLTYAHMIRDCHPNKGWVIMSGRSRVTRANSTSKRANQGPEQGPPNKKQKAKTSKSSQGKGKPKGKKTKDVKESTHATCSGETTTKKHPQGYHRAIYAGDAGLLDQTGSIQYPSPTFDTTLTAEVLQEQRESSILKNIAIRTARPGHDDPRPQMLMIPIELIRLWKSDDTEGKHLFSGRA
jgi:hypothetical protein